MDAKKRLMKHIFVVLAVALYGCMPLPLGAGEITNYITPPPDIKTMLPDSEFAAFDGAVKKVSKEKRIAAAIDWLVSRIQSGSSVTYSMLASELLWTEGVAIASSDPAHDSRVTAGSMALYALGLIYVDGEKCEDQTAGSFRYADFAARSTQVLEFLRKQDAETRSEAVRVATVLENHNHKQRSNDEFICRGGMSEIQVALHNGKQRDVTGTREAGGRQGKTIVVEAPPSWRPKFLELPQYEIKYGRKRRGLKLYLERLLR